jgi:hypothetical protein
MRHLRVFGCDAYAHVLIEKRSKLEKKVVKCIFIVYVVGVKGYKLWDLVAQNFIYNKTMILSNMKLSTVKLYNQRNRRKKIRRRFRYHILQ